MAAVTVSADGHFNIPEGTTTIEEGSWEEWGVDREDVKTVTIPNSVTTIGNSAFEGCSSLASITIPDSVTTIGGCAFYRCSSLASITIPDSVTTIGKYAFSGCSTLTSIAIPNSVPSIGDCAFYECSSLASITIPDSVTTIGNGAFNGCSSLASITIPDSVGTIGINTFFNCNLLTTAIIRRTAAVANHDGDGNASTDVWRTAFELPPLTQYGNQPPILFEHVTRISAPDAVINQLTGPFGDFTCLAEVPRAMRVAPDATTWAGVELWLDWSPPTAAGYTDKTRTVCASRQRTLFVTMLGAARAARPPPVRSTGRANAMRVAVEHRLPALPEELWVLIFGLLKHDTPPAF